jgi:ATP-binding cassette subfamily F protein uup
VTPRPPIPILTVLGLEKSFGTRRVLGGVSFTVNETDRIALIGVNGAGKSTLLRLLAGEAGAGEGPDAGTITRRRGITMEYVAQEPRLDVARTVGETMREGLRAHARALGELDALGAEIPALTGPRLDAALAAQAALHDRIVALGGWDQDHEVRSLAAGLAVPADAAVIGTLSLGERRRVAIARALLARPDLLALDEPTNHLDAATIAWLETRLLEQGRALLLVTHDRYFLDRVATHILELDRGRLFAYAGGYSRFLEKQSERLAGEATREQARAAFVRRELDWIRRGPKARGTKQQARIDRFDDAVAARPRADERRGGPLTLRLSAGDRLGKTILELRGLAKSLGGKTLFRDLDLLFKPGDRIGVVGPNGAGKTTLVRTILGELAADAGEVVVGQNTRIAFLDQARATLDDAKTVLQEVAGDNDHVLLAGGPVHARTFLRLLLFDDAFADTPVGVLSGGERNRVQLAKLLRAGGNFLVLDEPTNDLDVLTLGVLEDALAEFAGCALIVSHDRWFLDKVATGILAFEGDGRVVFYEGSCSDYLARPKSPSASSGVATRAAGVPAAVGAGVVAARRPDDAPRPRKRTFKERQELAAMEPAILAAERDVAGLEQTLQDPIVYATRAPEVPTLVARLEAARRRVDALYARWQALEQIPD